MSAGRPSARDVDDWVNQGSADAAASDPPAPPTTTPAEREDPPAPEMEPTSRLTLDIPVSLHKAIKVSCAERGIRMVQDIIPVLDAHYRPASD